MRLGALKYAAVLLHSEPLALHVGSTDLYSGGPPVSHHTADARLDSLPLLGSRRPTKEGKSKPLKNARGGFFESYKGARFTDEQGETWDARVSSKA
jgi:hypothetical protein